MGDVKWIKVSTDMFNSSRKIKQIEVMPEGDTILVIWLKLLLLAGNINDDGAIYLTPEIPYTEEMLANELRRPITTVRMALKLFEQFGMVEIVDNILYLSAWEKYQSTDKLAEMRAKDRDRKRLKRAREKGLLPDSAECPRNVHGQSTDSPHIEEDGEKDSEKESHSFTHTAGNVENFTDSPESRRRYLGGIGKGVVFLSDEQMDDLLDKLSVEEFDKYVEVIAECELNGHRYKKKTHYQAILDMAAKDRKIK
jgi:predicted phage replisome organizer